MIVLTLEDQGLSWSSCAGEAPLVRKDSTVVERSGSPNRRRRASAPTCSLSVSLTPHRRLFTTCGFLIHTSTADQKPSGRLLHSPGNFESNSFVMPLAVRKDDQPRLYKRRTDFREVLCCSWKKKTKPNWWIETYTSINHALAQTYVALSVCVRERKHCR